MLATAAEVPVCASAGASATGAAVVLVSEDKSSVTVRQLEFQGLSGPAMMAHVHAGAMGQNGPIVFDLGTSLTPPIERTFTEADYPSPPPSGAPADYAAFVRSLEGGGAYLNIHTAACPPGEIRGQI